MSTFAFRNDFPKRGENWDRGEVAKALRQGRTALSIQRNAGADVEEGVKGQIREAAKVLALKSQQPARKLSKKWSDNMDRETLSHQLMQKYTRI